MLKRSLVANVNGNLISIVVNARRTKAASIEFVAGMIVCVPFKDEITGDNSFWLAKVRKLLIRLLMSPSFAGSLIQPCRGYADRVGSH